MPSYSGTFTLPAQMQAIAAGTWTGLPPPGPSVIGEAFGGGFYAGQISTTANGVATHYLVVGPIASAQSTKQWKTSGTTTSGTTSVIDGPANSTAMNTASHPAAYFCKGLTVGDFSDWYMPARYESEVCYYNLKPTTQSNLTYQGSNSYAVPSRGSNYTAGTPAQTSAADFQSGGTEAFSNATYWTSTETTNTQAFMHYFSYGGIFNGAKTGAKPIRAIRRVPV